MNMQSLRVRTPQFGDIMRTTVLRSITRASLALVVALGLVTVAADAPAGGATKGGEKPGDTKDLATVEREAFSIQFEDAQAKAGTSAEVTITVNAKGSFHLNQEYPHKLTLEDVPAGLRVAKTDFKKADASLEERSLAFKLAATPEKPGRYTVSATLKTSVCDDKQCILKSERIAIRIVGK
jgi:hypothetical protein